MMRANHRYYITFAASVVLLCIEINESNRSKRCTETQIGNESGTCSAGADTESKSALLNLTRPPVYVVIKLSELDDSSCNRIRPLSIFQCEVYQTFPDNSIIEWYVDVNGTESENLVIFKRELESNVARYSLKEESVSEFKLTASTILVHDKTHCTEPKVISTLTVHPPTSIINVNIKPFNVTCGVRHTSYQFLSVTITHRDLTADHETPSKLQDLQLQCQCCNDNNCTLTVSWNSSNEDCIAFYDVMVTHENTTDHSVSLVAKSNQTSYSCSVVLPQGSYNATVIAENTCGLRSEESTATLNVSECAMTVCPKCGGTKSHDITAPPWTMAMAILLVSIT